MEFDSYNNRLINLPLENFDVSDVFELYNTYMQLFEKYYCEQGFKKDEKTGRVRPIYSYKHDLFMENDQFLNNWQAKRAKIKARLKSNHYFSSASLGSDLSNLKNGQIVYDQLMSFFELGKKIRVFEDMYENPEAEFPLREKFIPKFYEPFKKNSGYIDRCLTKSMKLRDIKNAQTAKKPQGNDTDTPETPSGPTN